MPWKDDYNPMDWSLPENSHLLNESLNEKYSWEKKDKSNARKDVFRDDDDEWCFKPGGRIEGKNQAEIDQKIKEMAIKTSREEDDRRLKKAYHRIFVVAAVIIIFIVLCSI